MLPITKRWWIAQRIPSDVERELQNYPEVLRQILYSRGFQTNDTARQFLEAQPPPGTHPLGMLGISQSVERLQRAIHDAEPIAIYGDYDVDGVTATALLVQALEALGARVRGYIPNRFDEGYGLNKEALDTLSGDGIRLVVTVDCGIRSIPEAEHAQLLGLDLIISDHHPPTADLPPALAIINPKQPGDTYPDKDLAGVGLAYKLASALFEHTEPSLSPSGYLDLVALGTVADLAPLVRENRALVRAGLEAIRTTQRQGLLSLIGEAGLVVSKVSSNDIGFALGPRLNAAGRIESALAAFQLLTNSDKNFTGLMAQELGNQNRERQRIMHEISAQAEQIALAENPDALLLFAAHPDFNPGVVGLAASRLSEQYYRPAIVAHQSEKYTRGSCRSIPEFHITQALDQCTDLLEHHGGHAAAAGFTVRNENLPELISRLQTIAALKLSSLELRPTLKADVELRLSELKPEILTYLEWLQPTGMGNPQAVFVSRNLKVTAIRTVGKDNSHLKLTVTDGRIFYDAIAFHMGYWADMMPRRVDLMYTFETNEYNERTYLQLKVRDLRPSEG